MSEYFINVYADNLGQTVYGTPYFSRDMANVFCRIASRVGHRRLRRLYLLRVTPRHLEPKFEAMSHGVGQ